MSLQDWEQDAVKNIFQITLDRQEAERTNWSLLYLSDVSQELAEENGGVVPKLSTSMADRIMLSRLSLDPVNDVMSDDADKLTALASLPKGETCWDYLVACWKRAKQEQNRLRKTIPTQIKEAQSSIDEISSLIVSYLGLVLQTPDLFPNNTKGKQSLSPLTALVPSLVNLSSTPTSAFSSSTPSTSQISLMDSWGTFEDSEVPIFLTELAKRFDGDGLDQILGPALVEIVRRIRDGDNGEEAGSSGSTSANGQQQQQQQPQQPQGGMDQAAAQAFLAQLLGQAPPNPGGPGPLNGLGALGRPPKEGFNISGLEWRPYVMAMVEASENKSIAAMMTTLSNFNPEGVKPNRLELDSLLGPIIRLSTFSDAFPSITQQYFYDVESRSAALSSTMNSMRSTLGVVHSLVFKILNSIIRSGPSAKEAVLRFWGQACQLNAKRSAMRVNPLTVASDGFMVNLYVVLLKFSEPFMDPNYTKIDRIDVEYLRTQKRFDVSSLTRLNATEPEANQWSEEAPPNKPAPNFITEVFFLAARLTNLGPGKAIRTHEESAKRLRRMKRDAEELESGRPSWSNSPQAREFEAQLKHLTDEVKKGKAQLKASEAQLLDPQFLQITVTWISFMMTWLVRVADPKQTHPKPTVELPLPQEVPLRFKMLPEHIFEDVCEILLFLGRHQPDCLSDGAKNDLVTFCTTFLSSGWYVTNPFLKAKLAEILFYNVVPYGYYTTGICGDLVNYHALAIKNLVPALMSFWIEAESTGSHTQFYDKFNIRYHLSQIFKAIWSNPQHKAQIQAQSVGENEKNFITFINRLMNDVTYLLEDSLTKLKELHTAEQELDDESRWGADRPANERQEAESHAHSLEGQARSDLQLSEEFLRLLIDFTGETKSGFMVPEIVDRLAAMLDYNLEMLVGPKCSELKVKDPKKTGFNPRDLLRQVLSVFLNLAGRQEFVQAIAKDGRSYSKETFLKAANVAQRHMLKSPSEIEALKGMVDQIETVRQMEADDEEELGEIPDDFLDPLMATLMKDPVILPSSRTIVDMSTIKQHFLSDASDPFNRVPLKIEDVLPATDLKAQITAFMAERKEQRKRAKLDDSVMDTSS